MRNKTYEIIQKSLVEKFNLSFLFKKIIFTGMNGVNMETFMK